MTTLERFELGAIAVLTAAVWLSATLFLLLPSQMSVANLILIFSVLLLLQSLIRDVSILLMRRKKMDTNPGKITRCMCIESAVGATGVLLAIGLTGLGVSLTIAMVPITWALGVFVITVIGFLIKDLVFQWSPWSVYKEKDHLNIIVSWKLQGK